MIFFEGTQKRLCVSADTSRSSASTRNISHAESSLLTGGSNAAGWHVYN